MALELLNCSICPKQPSFSDTSHLLTHVSSKGHLSHLHKLQVRSHQEIAAGVRLATYNQWYQHHGLGQLLSERLLQKEAKQKRKYAGKRGGSTGQHGAVDQRLVDGGPSRRGQGRSMDKPTLRRRPTRVDLDEDSDVDFSPAKRIRHRPRRGRTTPPGRHVPPPAGLGATDDPRPAEIDPEVLATPEHNKLKGTVWPGMAIFDAATSDMRRRRNQKKDGSVVRRMEQLSAMVHPTEVVYSPGGHVRKQRHIDDLEDASSLVDGESPPPKPKQSRPRKRQPLGDRDPNVPRLVRSRGRNDVSKRMPGVDPLLGLPPLPYLPSSSTGDSYCLASKFLPTDDEHDDLKPTFSRVSARQRSTPLTVFNNGSPGYMTAFTTEARHDRFPGTGAPRLDPPRPYMAPIPAPGLIPPSQSLLPYNDPYPSYRAGARGDQTAFAAAEAKENMSPLLNSSGFRGLNANPLSWKSPMGSTAAPFFPSESPGGGLFGMFPLGGHIDDPFVTNKNPLAEAMAMVNDDHAALALSRDCLRPAVNTLSDED